MQMARIDKIDTELNIPVPDPITLTQNGVCIQKKKKQNSFFFVIKCPVQNEKHSKIWCSK